jgi:hypothetical protein
MSVIQHFSKLVAMFPGSLRRICDGVENGRQAADALGDQPQLRSLASPTRERRSLLGEIAGDHQGNEFAL